MKTKSKQFVCSICIRPIEPEISGWARGHNAEPINNGRCCSDCNSIWVVPMRIALMVKEKAEDV